MLARGCSAATCVFSYISELEFSLIRKGLLSCQLLSDSLIHIYPTLYTEAARGKIEAGMFVQSLLLNTGLKMIIKNKSFVKVGMLEAAKSKVLQVTAVSPNGAHKTCNLLQECRLIRWSADSRLAPHLSKHTRDPLLRPAGNERRSETGKFTDSVACVLLLYVHPLINTHDVRFVSAPCRVYPACTSVFFFFVAGCNSLTRCHLSKQSAPGGKPAIN